MKKSILLTAIAILVIVISVGCTSNASKDSEKSFNYYTAEETKKAIENQEDIILLDIQPKEDWDKHHIQGAIATHAYPVKTDEDKSKLESALDKLQEEQPIVIVCPRGGGGAERTYEYLNSKDIDESRLFILENGQAGWPYGELLEK